MLLDTHVDIFSCRLSKYFTSQFGRLEVQPLRKICRFFGTFKLNEQRLFALVLFDRNNVANFHLIAGDSYAFAIDGDETVVDKLSCLRTGHADTETVYNVVKSALQKYQHIGTGDALLAFSFLIILMELLLLQSVNALRLLLFTKLQSVFCCLLSAVGVYSGDFAAACNRALVGVASIALQKQLAFFPSAVTAICACISCHGNSPLIKLFYAWADGIRCER